MLSTLDRLQQHSLRKVSNGIYPALPPTPPGGFRMRKAAKNVSKIQLLVDANRTRFPSIQNFLLPES